jgi:gliding motility-associated-like protein
LAATYKLFIRQSLSKLEVLFEYLFSRILILFSLLIFGYLPLTAHDQLFLFQNKGQWHPDALYRADIPSGYFYMDREGFTYQFYDVDAVQQIHKGERTGNYDEVNVHVIKTRFVGCNAPAAFEQSEPSAYYNNYFLGNDSTRWASNVHSNNWVTRKEIYSGIDLKVYRKNEILKYDLILNPGANPNQILMEYDGASGVNLKNGQLHVSNSLVDFIEQPPFAYQVINGLFKRISCNYVLDGNQLSFEFPEGYNPQFPLIIDPEISFSSYLGSGSSNFGNTATYDEDGNLYGGVIVFGLNFPVVAGAYDASFNGGNIDVGVAKFSADGTQLLYATYLGGSANESPHSLVVNDNNELYILGTTGSNNFPTTGGAYQNSFNSGGTFTYGITYGFGHDSGTDIFVARLSANGSNLLSSTYIGGSGVDGLNRPGELHNNYGDAFRGEIILDDNGNVLVASVTESNNFPVTAGAFQAVYGGGVADAVVFKMNAGLSNLLWSTYLGGNQVDASYSLQIGPTGNVYVAGGTKSNNFPTTGLGAQPNYMGNTDGFVLSLSPNGQTMAASSFVGNATYNECYFVQLDTEGEVYVAGQTGGNYPISPGVYSNPGSGQFIQKLSADLSTNLLSTVFGNGNGMRLSISAFLVSECDQIYVSGWGGQTNQSFLTGSTTTGFPTTPDAFQSTTDGSDFYLIVLTEDMTSLEYATFFGGPISNEHVDGGTSRFDKSGTVYQAVCAGCQGNSDFPTQPGVWSQTNTASGSGQCDLGVFKFNLSTITASIAIDGPSEVCAGVNVNFTNNSEGSDQYLWNFGGQGTSSAVSPNFIFDTPGEYTITLLATHSNECLEPDSTEISITILPPPQIDVSPDVTICAGDSIQLFADGADSYSWSPANQVSNPNIADPWVWANNETVFTVSTTSECGSVSFEVELSIFDEDYGAGPLQTICLGESVQLSAYGGGTYQWETPEWLSNVTLANPIATPEETTQFNVTITSPNGCEYTSAQVVNVLPGPPDTYTSEIATICNGGSAYIWALGGETYIWLPAAGMNTPFINNPIVTPTQSTTYYVQVGNECGFTLDSVYVHVGELLAQVALPDTVCPGNPVQLQASGGVSYHWSPENFLTNTQISNPVSVPEYTTNYSVVVYDEYGCADIAHVTVYVHSTPFLIASQDQIVDYYTHINFTATSNGTLTWESEDDLSCNYCDSPNMLALENTVVYVTATDQNGCQSMDSIEVFVTGTLYVPNAFTPNGDGINDFFRAQGKNIEQFQMRIFDRWGELIFESFSIDDGWNGAIGNYLVQPDVYVWDIVAKEHTGVAFERRGHVTVVR